MNSIRKYVAEFIGTFVLVLFACGTAAVTGCSTDVKDVSYLLTALAFGLVIVAMAYSIGNISGCHINPAVSIAMLVNGKLSIKDFIGYILAQFAGGIAGAATLLAIFGKELTEEIGLGANGLYNNDAKVSFILHKQTFAKYHLEHCKPAPVRALCKWWTCKARPLFPSRSPHLLHRLPCYQ